MENFKVTSAKWINNEVRGKFDCLNESSTPVEEN